MTPERWQQIEEIFQTAIERSPDERAAYLTQFCEGDEELRREVESLLAEDENRARAGYDTLIGEPIRGAARSLTANSEQDLVGVLLGPYRVTGLVGTGGMGAVYAAVRDDGLFKQRVAIKVVRRGMDSRFVLSRFARERRILASLEHPNIARLIDGGQTENGLPYFVMEFVEGGKSITDYCTEKQLSIPDRLRLFRQVCDAVQYAHRKLIVHRDLKPGNILVNRDGAPKLLDFGLAKLLDPAQTEADPARTATMERMLTPDYGSPEQARGAAITTATDVYSLGAVLYELLTAQRPHQFATYTLAEIERVICESAPLRPSEALERMREEGGGRKARGRKLFSSFLPHPSSLLRGDLDNIVLMAMRKEPERRYSSVEQFSDDLRRHLEGLPVVARRDTVRYRAGKFVRRHKVMVAAMLLVMLSLLVGVIVATYQARRAERRFAQVRHLANTFLFEFHDGIKDLPGTTQSRELVARTALEYLDSLAVEAAGDSELLLELAQAYLKVGDVQGDPWSPNLGQSAAAMRSYQKAVELAEQVRRDNAANTVALRLLAAAYGKIGMLQAEAGDKRGGQQSLRQGEQIANTLVQQTGEFNHLALAETLASQIGQIQLDTGDALSAVQSFNRSFEWAKQAAAKFPNFETRAALAVTHGFIGEALGALGDLPAAIESYRQAAAIHESLLREQPDNVRARRGLRASYSWIGSLLGNPNYVNQGDLAGATDASRKALALAVELAARDRKNVLAQTDLAATHARLGDVLVDAAPQQALEQYRQALAITWELISGAPQEFRIQLRHAICLTKFGGQLCRMGRCREGIGKLTAARDLLQALAARDSANMQLQADWQLNLLTLAESLSRSGNREAALAAYRQTVEVAERADAASPHDLNVRLRLIQSYESFGRYYAALGKDSTIAPAERLNHRQSACDWQRKALALWTDWSKRVKASNFGLTRHDQAARAVAECK